MKQQRRERKGNRTRSTAGFGLIEAMFAVLILVVGLTALLALFTQSIATAQLAQQDMIARQKAREALESIYTARNTSQVTFDMLQNLSAGGIFLEGEQPLRTPNPSEQSGDGLVGTADDGPIEVLRESGEDGVLGTDDDEIRVLSEFTREILFSEIVMVDGNPNPDLRQVEVFIRYSTAMGLRRTFRIESRISRFR